ncbi:MAG: type II secretion system GspH family protein [Opitutaceae bacterium]|jgi:prepilin-type N-terminal cleavage/methylation domain-containing protein/prepilin-type processing-associated H-X9-DG protein|nr:type II secretion system GspH family protein [Opitutaceae bacterium]
MNIIRKSYRKSGCSGFTLIELLTVIVIIGVLAAILIPVLGKVRESVASATTLGSLKQLYLGARMYANDNKGNLPPVYIKKESGTGDYWWAQTLCMGGYLGETTPVLKTYLASYKNPLVQRKQGESAYNQLGCFGMNTSIPGSLVVNGNPLRTSIAIDRLAWPSRTVLFADANLRTNNVAEVALVDESTKYILLGRTAYPNTWSGGSAHYVFADGSARKIKAQNPEEMNSPPAGLDETVFFTITCN